MVCRLWTHVGPALGLVVLLCFITLVIHEVRVLSTVAILYVQAGILFLTTAASLALWIRSLSLQKQEVKGVIMGCNVFIWAMAFLGFLRAAIVWMAERDEGEGERRWLLRGERFAYGTAALGSNM